MMIFKRVLVQGPVFFMVKHKTSEGLYIFTHHKVLLPTLLRMTKYLVLLSFLWAVSMEAQSPVQPVLCGNDIFSDIVRKHYPSLQESFDQTFDAALSAPSSRNLEPLTVKVVVHVVWKNAAENLDDSIILDQLRILNEDFNRHNADTTNLRTFFQPEAGSPRIQFELAEIIRVQTEVEFAVDLLGTNLLPEVKADILGGSNAWDPEQYLNIWVCKIQPITISGVEVGQILGFAFPPNNLPNWPENSGAPDPFEDGVVIDFRVFGSNNPNPIVIAGGGGDLEVKGRTPVHEVGHYFGLRHIWGDGGLLGANDCAQSDGIDDTPYANAQSAFDCDTTKNTCTQSETHYNADVPDLIENFMDYSSETCMNMFTKGQSGLMRNVLMGPRSGLLAPPASVDDNTLRLSFQIEPNPNNGEFAVSFHLEESCNAALVLFNLNGEVKGKFENQTYLPGHHRKTFEGLSLSPGVYFVEIRNEKGAYTEKLIVY